MCDLVLYILKICYLCLIFKIDSLYLIYEFILYRNLLRPAGVQLRPATFAVNVYKCEDIPRSKYSTRQNRTSLD